MNAANGMAPYTSFPYPAFEWAFLQWVQEIDLSPRQHPQNRSTLLADQLSDVQAKMETLSAKLDQTGNDGFARLVDMLAKLESQEAAIKLQLDAERATASAPRVSTADIGRLADEMQAMPAEQRSDVRTRLKIAIASVVKNIKLHPYSHKMMRLAIVVVTLMSGEVRVLVLRVERGKHALSVSTGKAEDPESYKFDPDVAAGIIIRNDIYCNDLYRYVVGEAILAACDQYREKRNQT
jgi:hypothetical protein